MSARTDAGPGVPADPFPQYETDEEVDAHVGAGGSVATHEAASDPHPQYDTAAEVAQRVTDHENLADPHPQYDTAAEAQTAVDTHAAASDPHTGYAKESEYEGPVFPVQGAFNGSTDDTSAWQTAITAAIAANGSVYAKAGTSICSNITGTGHCRIIGQGPEKTIVKAKTGATTPLWGFSGAANETGLAIEDLSFDLTNAKTIDAVYVTGYNKPYVSNLKFRFGRRQLWLGDVSAAVVGTIWGMNFSSCVIYVEPPNPATAANPTGDQPNFVIDTVFSEATSANNGVATDACVWVNCFTAGFVLRNIWAIKSTASNTGTLATGIRIDATEAPSGSLGHFAELSHVNTDGIDGPGVLAHHCRQLQLGGQSFLGTRPASSGGTGAGVKLTGTCRDIMLGGESWVSGSGLEIDSAATVTTLQVDSCNFPQTVTGGAIILPSGATVTRMYIGPNNNYVTDLAADDATKARIMTAGIEKKGSSPQTWLISDVSLAERLKLYNPNGPIAKYIGLTASGTLQFLSSNGTLIFSIQDSGNLQMGTSTTALTFTKGTATPEGAVSANVGSLRLRTDGGSNSTLYVKESGTGNTGWVAYGLQLSTSTPAAIGSAAAGSGTAASKSDHVHATGAGTPTTSALADAAATGSGPAASMTDHVHGRESFGSSAAAVGSSAAGTATTPSHSDHVHATGAGTPSTQAFSDSAATGTGPAASMTDHKHAMMASPITTTVAFSGAVTTDTSTGAITDLTITNAVYRWNGASAATLHGIIASPGEGRIVLIENTSSTQTLTLANQSATETSAARRIICPDAADTLIGPLSSLLMSFDATTNRWRVFELASYSSTPAAIGTAAAGTGGVAESRGDHVHATGAGTPSTQAMGDAAATGSGPAAAMTDHKHALGNLSGNVTTSGSQVTTIANQVLTGPMDALSPATRPNANLMVGWSEDMSGCSTARTPAAATIYLRKIMVPTSITIANVIVMNSTAGTSYTNAQLGLYNSSGTLLGSSAVQASGGTNGFGGAAPIIVTLALSAEAGQSLTITGGETTYVWAALHMGTNSATAAIFFGCNTTAVHMNAGLAAATARAASVAGHATNSLHTIGNLTPSGFNISNSVSTIWMGVS